MTHGLTDRCYYQLNYIPEFGGLTYPPLRASLYHPNSCRNFVYFICTTILFCHETGVPNLFLISSLQPADTAYYKRQPNGLRNFTILEPRISDLGITFLFEQDSIFYIPLLYYLFFHHK